MLLHISYSNYKATSLTCPNCTWTGTGQNASQNFDGLVMDLECPTCFKMLAIVDFPTIGQGLVRSSEAERQALIRKINFQERFRRLSLKSADELPELEGENFIFTFRSETIKGDDVNVIEFQGQTVWQEPMVFEGYERFIEIGSILKEKYGNRMKDLVPDETAELFLYGDKLKAPANIANFRQNLNKEFSK